MQVETFGGIMEKKYPKKEKTIGPENCI